MIQAVRTMTFTCGEKVTLQDVRDIVAKTKDMPADTRVEPRILIGQRDSQSYIFLIEEKL